MPPGFINKVRMPFRPYTKLTHREIRVTVFGRPQRLVDTLAEAGLQPLADKFQTYTAFSHHGEEVFFGALVTLTGLALGAGLNAGRRISDVYEGDDHCEVAGHAAKFCRSSPEVCQRSPG